MKVYLTGIIMLLFAGAVSSQVVFNAPTGNLIIAFPDTPTVQKQEMEVTEMDVVMYSYSLSLDTASYFVSEVTYPTSFDAGSDMHAVLDRAASGFFEEFDMVSSAATTVYCGSIEGAEYKQKNEMFGITYRVFFWKNTLIQIGVMGYGDYLSDSDLRKFFSGIKINL
ncbi:MAG: hypothetical protein A2W93_00105 [Bacteroidetes bacterium GWF2_43_63]|nr:MAG: hypothetical protein A2W94_11385 [Bacteroidetes bacterium GWE2_42_42]OFY52683.1 MAG: hypothetical protein A2W93_00105 [Bacteroidetes bacterium GWF2_43_63]HBG69303.1 hypothetical protein [Bacteroidales bacterium]HCB60357.1 hypothetical protein [Bacteroidales bacterium]HCY23656.1 hypothetical protein [Bacteroidales bacterium]